MKTMDGAVGIVAGSGQFPVLVARSARAAGRKVCICAFQGQAGADLAAEADECTFLHVGQLGKLIKFFKKHEVKTICLAGAIKKARLLDLKPDLRAAALLLKLAKNHGDDAILRAALEEIQSEGIQVVQAAEFAPELFAPAGVLTARAPGADEWRSIRHGWPIGKALGAYDIGQCLVLRRNMVVAVEALEGTDAALERGGCLGGPGCVALKLLKPGQDRRADLPALGLETVRLLVKYHYACLAYEAGAVLFFDREESVALADAHKTAIIGLPPGEANTV
jgi:DUF1009 family protein